MAEDRAFERTPAEVTAASAENERSSEAKNLPVPTSNGELLKDSTDKAPVAVDQQNEATPEEPSTPRQRFLGWLVGLAGLGLPMLLVIWMLNRYSAHEFRTFHVPGQVVTCVAFSPDGETVAAGVVNRLTGGVVYLWDRESGEKLHELRVPGDPKIPVRPKVYCVAFSPDGKTLLTGDEGDARLWDVATGKLIHRLESQRNWVITAAFSPNGKYVVTSSRAEGELNKATGKVDRPEGVVRWWDVETKKQVKTYAGHTKPVTSLAFSPDGKLLLTGDGSTIWLWDVRSNEVVQKLDEEVSGVRCLVFSPDGQQFAYGGNQKTIQLYDLKKKQFVARIEGHKSPVNSIDFSSDGRFLVSGSMGTWKSKEEEFSAMPDEKRTVRVWDLETGRENYHFEDVRQAIWSIAFAPDGRYLLAGGAEKAQIWWLP